MTKVPTQSLAPTDQLALPPTLVIGKLLEKIMASLLDEFLIKIGIASRKERWPLFNFKKGFFRFLSAVKIDCKPPPTKSPTARNISSVRVPRRRRP